MIEVVEILLVIVWCFLVSVLEVKMVVIVLLFFSLMIGWLVDWVLVIVIELLVC